jgi:hypothetical protein
MAAFSHAQMPEGSLARGTQLQHRLFRALDDASSVTVVEHGNRADMPEHKDWVPPTYAKVILTPKQIQSLRNALPAAKDISGEVSLACIFDDHHAIVIQEKDGDMLTLNLCFVCGELSLNHDEERIMPDGWPESLSRFIASLGLHPNGPWRGPGAVGH